MAAGDKHTLTLGTNWPGWNGHANNVTIVERKTIHPTDHEDRIYFEVLSTGVQGSGSTNKQMISALTIEDAEALCFLLYDLTQPLRDEREAKLKESPDD